MDLSGKRKFKNFFLSAYALRKVSDFICLEHGLSVLEETPRQQWQKKLKYQKRLSHRDIIRNDIDAVLKSVTEGKPKGWKVFQMELEKLGYEVKWGKDLSVRRRGMKQFVRLKSLGKGYTEEEILIAVTEDATKRIARQIEQNNAPPQFLIDIEQKIREGKGKGYENWASDFNFKQKAKTLFFLQDNKIRTMEEIEEKVKSFTVRFNGLSDQIKEKEKRLREIGEIKKSNYRLLQNERVL